MARLALTLLGPFFATLNGKPIKDFDSDRVRALLAYLAVERSRPHRREVLAGLLWPDWPDRSATTNLRNSLANLRKAIGDRTAAAPVLLIDRQTVQFNPAGDSQVDVQDFLALTSADRDRHYLEEGIGLYRGPFLEGFGLRDSSPFEEWVQAIREQMQRRCLSALEQVAEHYEQDGNLAKAREYAWRQIDLAPWQERAHQRLMRLLALSGQRAAALAQYETCRDLMRSEFGVEPSPETVAQYERIRDGIVEPREETITTSISSNLPVWPTPLVGRQDLLAEIDARLKDPACRLLTLLGPGGSGKTRLAIEAATHLAPVFPHGAHFVSLAPLQSAENIVPAIAHVIGFPFHEQEEPLEQLLHYLRQKKMLLVLDNFEHLLSGVESEREHGAAVVASVLQGAPDVKLLVTSRIGLSVHGEYVLPIPGMEYPEQVPGTESNALSYSAVQLFIQDARRIRHNFQPEGDELAKVVDICRLVQGMPLGILLAAAWMRILSPAEIAAQLATHQLDFLAAEWRDAPERQRSMRAAFEYSWRLLSERERHVMAGLSVFRGGFTYSAMQQVVTVEGAAATLRDLIGLVNSSMVQRTPAGRYDMHELLRQFAQDKLRALPGGDPATCQRHAAFYAAALRGWATDLTGAFQQDAMQQMVVENDNVRAAWSWAVAHGQVDSLTDGLKGLGLFCEWGARYKEGEKAFRKVGDALAARAAALTVEQLKLWASALTWQARFHQRLGQVEAARQQARAALTLLKGARLVGQDTRREKALGLQVIGEIELQLGDCQDGEAPLTQSLLLWKELDDRWSETQCLFSLGRVCERMGQYARAAQLHRESVAICRDLGGQRDIIDASLHLLVDLAFLGEGKEAENLLENCLAICRKLGDRVALTAVRYKLAQMLMDHEPAESAAILEECVAIYSELGDRHRWALALMRLGDARVYLGRYGDARVAFRDSLAWYRETDNRWGIGAALESLARLELLGSDYVQARQLGQESVDAFRRGGAQADAGGALIAVAMAAVGLREFSRARESLVEALQLAFKFRHSGAPLDILVASAFLAAEEARGAQAEELWTVASSAYDITSSCAYQDLYRQHIAPVVVTLPPELVGAAQARGRGKDVWATLEQLQSEMV